MHKILIHLKYQLTIVYAFFTLGLIAQQAVVFTIEQPPFFEVKTSGDIVIDGVNPVFLHVEVSGGSGNYTYRWSPASLLDDSTAASPRVISFDGPRVFTVEVSDGHCIKSATVRVDLSTSSREIDLDAGLIVYPQPVGDQFHLVTEAAQVDLKLLDLTGRTHWQAMGVYPAGPHRLDGITPGMYILLITGANQPTKRIKLCKQ